jgi:hypothetical protein
LTEPSLVVDGMANGLPCAAEHTLRPFWHVLTKITRSTEQNCCENMLKKFENPVISRT